MGGGSGDGGRFGVGIGNGSGEGGKRGPLESGIPKRGKRDNGCIPGSVVVGREYHWWRRPHQRSGETRYYSLLYPPRFGGQRTLTEAEAKWEVCANDEEVKQREDKHDKTKLIPLLFMRA